jgi:ketosteroid isomerase-like protein
MKRTHIRCSVVRAACWMSFLSAGLSGAREAGAQDRAGFDAFFDRVTRAETELFRGRAEPLKALWSHTSDVTLFGVSGGRGAHGWDQVGERLDWASTQYSGGSLTVERIASYVAGDLGYVAHRERVRFKVPGQARDSILEIRATWIFRRVRNEWRIVHRQADPLMNRQGPAEVKK